MFKLSAKLATFFLCCVISNVCFGSMLGEALQAAKEKELHKEKDWQHLIQYAPRILKPFASEIKSEYSFFSKDGATNPQSELNATLTALFETPLSIEADEHPRCKFIARYDFLNTHLVLPEQLKSMSCPQFESWLDIDKIESVSLVFASGYFRNPASFFGHPILKFNQKSGSSSNLLDITLNNGAIVPPNENPVAYVIKGVFGGYKAAFSDTKFYQLNHSYVESDLRDLWHYELNLDKEQVKRLVYYSWELLGHRFTYRFFSNNCGYFLEDLLQYAIGKRLSPRNRIYSVPSTTFFNLVKAENNNGPLVKNIEQVPSRHSQLFEKYSALSDQERVGLEYYLDNNVLPETLNTLSQIRVIDTLTDYYSYLSARTKNKGKKQQLSSKRSKLFGLRLSLIKHDIEWPEVESSTAPHTGSRPSLLRVSGLYNSELGSGLKLRLRPASYDLIDLDGGHVPDSKLNFFNIEAVSVGGKQRLTRFDIVDITTLNLSRTGLPGDGGLGWGLRVGFESANNDCIDCLLAYAAGSAIKAKKIAKQWTVYVQGEASYHSTFENSSLGITPSVAIIGHVNSYWKTHLIAGKRLFIDGDRSDESNIKWENRFGNNPNSNFRLDVNYNEATEITLGYGIYW